jgi:hypothetical protein
MELEDIPGSEPDANCGVWVRLPPSALADLIEVVTSNGQGKLQGLIAPGGNAKDPEIVLSRYLGHPWDGEYFAPMVEQVYTAR